MKRLIISVLLIAILCSSCNKHFYAPALYDNDISYQPKPASFDSAKSATYVSLGEGFNQAVNLNNTVSFGEFDISEGHVFKNSNLSYGAFGFAGSIDNSNHQNELKDPHSFESKGFAGIGARASFNMFKAIEENVNFRYIGVEATYSKEYGDFAAYRREIQNLPDYSATTRTEMLTVGATSEILWHSPNSTSKQFAFRFFLGKTFGDYSYLKNNSSGIEVNNIPLYFTAAYFMQIKHFWGAAELTRNDISIPGVRIKVGYRF
ncbi:MAG: hypothetical protein V4592_13510 [Bacteroidota bacterium]